MLQRFTLRRRRLHVLPNDSNKNVPQFLFRIAGKAQNTMRTLGAFLHGVILICMASKNLQACYICMVLFVLL